LQAHHEQSVKHLNTFNLCNSYNVGWARVLAFTRFIDDDWAKQLILLKEAAFAHRFTEKPVGKGCFF